MTCGESALAIRKAHREPIELRHYDQLATQTAFRPTFGRDISQHESFIIRRRRQFVQPGPLHVAMTGGAGALAAALRLDALETRVHRAAHDALAALELQRALAAIGLDVYDSRHDLRPQRFAIQRPALIRAGAELQVEIDRWLVPVEYRPFQPPAAALARASLELAQQC